MAKTMLKSRRKTFKAVTVRVPLDLHRVARIQLWKAELNFQKSLLKKLEQFVGGQAE